MRTRLSAIAAFAAAFIAIPTTAGTTPVPVPIGPSFVEPDDVLSMATHETRVVTPVVEQPRRVLPPYRMSLDCVKVSRVTDKGSKTTREERTTFRYEDVIDRQGAVFQTGLSTVGLRNGQTQRLDCTLLAGRGGPVISLERAQRLPGAEVDAAIGGGGVSMWRDPKTGRWMGLGGVSYRYLGIPAYGMLRHTFTMEMGGPDRQGEQCFFMSARLRPGSRRPPRQHGAHPEWGPVRKDKDEKETSSSPAQPETHACAVKPSAALDPLRRALCPGSA